MDVSEFETKLINLYARAEFLGALEIAKFSKHIFDPYVKSKLVWHSMEEMRHAFILYDFLRKNNLDFLKFPSKPEEIFPLFYNNYAEGLVEFFSMVHIFELRAPFTYKWLIQSTTNPDIIRIANQLIKDEEPHLKWIRDYLKERQKTDSKRVENAFKKYCKIEKENYENDLKLMESLFGKSGEKYFNIIKSDLHNYEDYKMKYLKETFNVVL